MFLGYSHCLAVVFLFSFLHFSGFRLSFPPHIPLLVDAHIFSGYLIFSALLTEINLNLNLLPKSLGSSRLIFYPLTLLLVYFTQSRTGLILGVLCIICYLGNSLLKTSIKLRLNITSSLIIGSTILFAFLVLFSSTPLLENLTLSKGFIRLTDLSFSDDSSLYRLSQFASIGDLSIVQFIFGVPLESGISIWRDGIVTFLTNHLGIIGASVYILVILYFLFFVSSPFSNKPNSLRSYFFIILLLYSFSNLITESAMISRSVIQISVQCAMLRHLLTTSRLTTSPND